ncbi:hypothetical protein KKE60_05530, partial [Patescibacteria group bacterium]|nr:hypothetical protein [Patescibacteria group bacterium]
MKKRKNFPKGGRKPIDLKKVQFLFNPSTLDRTIGIFKMFHGLMQMIGMDVFFEGDAQEELVGLIVNVIEKNKKRDGMIICQHGVFECEMCRKEQERREA